MTNGEILKTGWLDTDGMLVECGEYQHLATARELVQSNHYPLIIDNDGRKLSDDEVLLRHGWVQIDYSFNMFFHGWRIYWNYRHRLSAAQKKFLEIYFEQSDVDPISLEQWNEEVVIEATG